MTPADARLTYGARLFDDGAYFDAHEVWEEIWRDEPPGARRTVLQGLIQAAAAFHKLESRGDPVSAARILGRACEKLRDLDGPEARAGFEGLELRTFRDALAACLAALSTPDARAASFDWQLVPRLGPR